MKTLLTLIGLYAFVTSATAATPPPNILLIVADDLTYRDLGCYGGQAKTPAIDHLATESLQFSRCFQAAPMCSPTRHSLYTGMYPVKTGAYPNHTFVSRPDTISIAQRLGEAGYRVALNGKRHINPRTVFPFEYLPDPLDPAESRKFVESCRKENKPFCLVLASHNPHAPWRGGDRSLWDPAKLKLFPVWADTPETREDYRNYLAKTSLLDQEVAAGLKLLADEGLVDSTVVIFLSEQGTSQPRAKWNLYDLGIQSGCLVRWPGVVKPGSKTDAMIEYVDVLPTLLEIAGGKITPDLDGRSFLGVLKAQTDHHKDYVFAVHTNRGVNKASDHYGIRAVRSQQYKYIWNFTPADPYANASLHSATYLSWEAAAAKGDDGAKVAIARYLHRAGAELYDVVADPFEMHNLAGDPVLADTEADLRARLLAWMKSQGDEGQATEMEAYKHLNKGTVEDDDGEERPAKGARKSKKRQKAE
jgi:N-sulfoglucosamine sulfohydrolase